MHLEWMCSAWRSIHDGPLYLVRSPFGLERLPHRNLDIIDEDRGLVRWWALLVAVDAGADLHVSKET